MVDSISASSKHRRRVGLAGSHWVCIGTQREAFQAELYFLRINRVQILARVKSLHVLLGLQSVQCL